MRKVFPLGHVLLAFAVALYFGVQPATVAHAQDEGAAAEHADAVEHEEAGEHAEGEHPEGDHGEGDHGDAEHAGGVPLDFKADLAFWSLIVFLLFLFVLGKFAWGPLAAALDERESRVRGDIAQAEAARLKAEKMLADHAAKLDAVQDEVKEILAEARRDADQARQNILGDTQREVDAMRQRTLDEIDRARDQALKELFDSMAGQVVHATEHVLGRSLGDGDQDRLIDEALSQFSARGGNGSS